MKCFRSVTAAYAIPIHPMKCVVDLRNNMLLGNTSTDSATLDHVVVKPDIDSKNPFTNLARRDIVVCASGNQLRISTSAETEQAIIHTRTMIRAPCDTLMCVVLLFLLP